MVGIERGPALLLFLNKVGIEIGPASAAIAECKAVNETRDR
jgi:hypothetical protein